MSELHARRVLSAIHLPPHDQDMFISACADRGVDPYAEAVACNEAAGLDEFGRLLKGFTRTAAPSPDVDSSGVVKSVG